MDDSKNVFLQGTQGTGAPPPGAGPTEPLAFASFACAVIAGIGTLAAMVFTPFVYLHLLFPGAIVCGHLALRRMRRNGRSGGRGMAIFGLVIGYFMLVLSLAGLLIVIMAMLRGGQ